MAYHKNEIPKGTLGEFSKVEEEWAELQDALQNGNAVLELCEFSDLLGAIEAYVQKRYNIEMDDLLHMSYLTKQAFKEGKR